MIVNIAGVWDPVAARHCAHIDGAIDDFLDRHRTMLSLHAVMPLHETLVAAFLRRNRRALASPTRVDFTRLIAVFERRFAAGSAERTAALALFKQIFDYAGFSDKYAKGWNAYGLCAGRTMQMCPYCHLHPTDMETGSKPGEGYRPQLDHYYPQSIYPFLGLTLGNLIPSCTLCNGPAFKHDKNFHAQPHLHPLADQENIGFRLKAPGGGMNDITVKALRAPLARYRLGLFALDHCPKTRASLRTFKLRARYQRYKADALHVAAQTLQKMEKLAEAEAYCRSAHAALEPSAREQMRAQVLGFCSTPESTLAFDPHSEDAYKDHPGGKMLRDIFLRARGS